MENAATVGGRGRSAGKPFPQADALVAARMACNPICVVPLTTALRRLGAMGFGSMQGRVYQEAELNFMQQVAKQVAVAVDNVLHDESAQAAQRQLTRERDRVRLLLEVNNAVVSHLSLDDLFPAVSACLRKVIQHDGSALVLYDQETRRYRVHVLHFCEERVLHRRRTLPSPDCKTPAAIAITTRKPAVLGEQDLKNLAAESPCAQTLGCRRGEGLLLGPAPVARPRAGRAGHGPTPRGYVQPGGGRAAQRGRQADRDRRGERAGLSARSPS